MKIEGGFKVMAVCAHPDDADIDAGALLTKLAAAGARVRVVSVCNGDKGHQSMPPAELAARRAAEAQRSAARLGFESYTVLNHPDCELEADLATRREITNIIREFAPDIVLTHRTCDYHADHRAVGTLVMDATYLLGVPHWCPETKRPKNLPAVMYIRDGFTVPREIRPDVMISADDVREKLIRAISEHESQVFEWLPFDREEEHLLPPASDPAGRAAYVEKTWFATKAFDAARFADAWTKTHPGENTPKYVEAYEVSEYGRGLTDREKAILR